MTGSMCPTRSPSAIDAIGVGWLAPIIKLGIVLGLSSVILVMMLGQTRDLSTRWRATGCCRRLRRNGPSALPHALSRDDR